MSQIRLLYYSRALQDMSLGDISNILQTARSNNQSKDICGMLCYESRWFLQVLEGEREVVNELFLEIADDPRHDDVVIISYDYVDTREFQSWQMGYAGSAGNFSELLQEFGLSKFSPDEMSPAQGFEFLKMMSAHQNENA